MRDRRERRRRREEEEEKKKKKRSFPKVWIQVWNLSKMYGYMFELYGFL